MIIPGLSLLPAQALAHGAEEEAKAGITLSTYFLIGTVLLFVLFLILYGVAAYKAKQLHNAKKQEDRYRRQQLTKTANRFRVAWILSLTGVIISGAAASIGGGPKEMSVPHIHGLGYSIDGERILMPAHNGIMTFSERHWSQGPGEKHDYMGFSAVDNGFYSSGHPAEGSNKKNPFGVVKSTDEGKNVQTLAVYGETDFHLMGASYSTKAIYVINPQPNTQMKSPGLYYSKDDGKTWTPTGMQGVAGDPAAIAVHPTNDAVVAIGTEQGLFLSKDSGQNFENLSDTQVTSLYFNQKGSLFIGNYRAPAASLLQLDIDTKQTIEMKIPELTEDAVAYFAQNPKNPNEFAFATFNTDVFLSEDAGETWTKIADKGKGKMED
ncbi:F510_1955 family glycosylhydrolase [Paenibacillus darwinianus]|uniref:F510_1955 family glycosylhydrolase n=1 Tax=Paenibacillus darwinianus TaxID=1380763 RepID=UPI001681621B|nr:glycosyl hydrolase [Paenibacillus darwinianus]